MNTKNFFTKIREIIREEIEYALEKKISQKQTKRDDISTLKHGISMYNESQTTKKVTKPKQQKSEFGSIQELLAETKRSLQDSYEMEDEFRFTADMAEGFGNDRGGSVIPQGYSKEDVPNEVMSALTRDYSALMKKIDEKKGR
jgi:galactokinase